MSIHSVKKNVLIIINKMQEKQKEIIEKGVLASKMAMENQGCYYCVDMNIEGVISIRKVRDVLREKTLEIYEGKAEEIMCFGHRIGEKEEAYIKKQTEQDILNHVKDYFDCAYGDLFRMYHKM